MQFWDSERSPFCNSALGYMNAAAWITNIANRKVRAGRPSIPSTAMNKQTCVAGKLVNPYPFWPKFLRKSTWRVQISLLFGTQNGPGRVATFVNGVRR